ncbi:MAG: DUF4173 domain-containing protein [Pseudomonadota bacterium]
MKAHTIHGVPLAMQQDGWWLSPDSGGDKADGRVRMRRQDGAKAALLLCLIAVGDVLVWNVMPAVGLALLALIITAAGLAVAWPRLDVRRRAGISAGAVLAILPLVELVQPLSMLIAFAGALVGCVVLAGVPLADLGRASLRLLWIGPVQSAVDAAGVVSGFGRLSLADRDLRALLLGWTLPVLATLAFLVLLAASNPVLDQVILRLTDFEAPRLNGWRIWFWGVLAALIWPVLVARRMKERLRHRAPQWATVQRQGVINAQSVARSLVAFNMLFAVQTGMDVLYLYGDAALPEGISPAAYAHRGAYPLLVTALLAGLFAVVARPFLRGQPVVRVLMLVWLGQTLALVFASVWRLDLYVEEYGLTRLRLAAYVWMGLVAAGLGIVLVQIWRDRPAIWMVLRSGALGVVALYACAFVSFDATIARHNLSHPVHSDMELLCEMSEDVVPVLRDRFGPGWRKQCAPYFWTPSVFAPEDWREWGFRNWRVRRSLAAMNITAAEIAVP